MSDDDKYVVADEAENIEILHRVSDMLKGKAHGPGTVCPGYEAVLHATKGVPHATQNVPNASALCPECRVIHDIHVMNPTEFPVVERVHPAIDDSACDKILNTLIPRIDGNAVSVCEDIQFWTSDDALGLSDAAACVHNMRRTLHGIGRALGIGVSEFKSPTVDDLRKGTVSDG